MCMAWTLSCVVHVAALPCNVPAIAFAPAPFLCGCRVGEADVPGPAQCNSIDNCDGADPFDDLDGFLDDVGGPFACEPCLGDMAAPFIAAAPPSGKQKHPSFGGHRPGYVFKADTLGIGNYLDGITVPPPCDNAATQQSTRGKPTVLQLANLVMLPASVAAPAILSHDMDSRLSGKWSRARHRHRSMKRIRSSRRGVLIGPIQCAETTSIESCPGKLLGLWVFDSFNPNTWARGLDDVLRSVADVTLIQETHVPGQASCTSAEAAARRKGVALSMGASVATGQNSSSAGVAIASKEHLGIASSPSAIVPSRYASRLRVAWLGAAMREGFT